ncbi:hypothetical protein Tco_1284008 [Tanacetum coccineum]
MVTATRSKSKKPDVSSRMNQVKDLAQRRQGIPFLLAIFLWEFFIRTLQSLIEIPQALYDAIKDADNIRKLLRKSLRTEYDLKKILDDTEKRINFLAFYYTGIDEELPRGWKYDHNTPSMPMVPSLLTPRKEDSRDKSTRLPTINGTALTGEEQKVWKNFTRMNIKVEARPRVSFSTEKYLIPVEETDPVVKLIVGFAVDAFNDFYHKYVKEHGSKNITQAVPLVCEYYKLTLKYCFYVTLDAIEQGKPGLYKAVVECDRVTGARTLCQFSLTDHKTKWETVPGEILPPGPDLRSFHQESEYEKAWSSDESEPEDFYEISGMVHRMATSGGGFDYHNPSSTFHRAVGYLARCLEAWGGGFGLWVQFHKSSKIQIFLLVRSRSAVTSNWAVCCILNPSVLPPIPSEGVKVLRETISLKAALSGHNEVSRKSGQATIEELDIHFVVIVLGEAEQIATYSISIHSNEMSIDNKCISRGQNETKGYLIFKRNRMAGKGFVQCITWTMMSFSISAINM